jgi:hypothetical protein
MNRVLRVARVQLTTWPQSFGWPVAILGISFLFNFAFFVSIGDELEGGPVTYGLVSIYIFQLIMASQMLTQGFSFAVGLNVTRRTFFAAASAVIGLQSIAFAMLLYALSIVEQLTGGWGMALRYFTVLPITQTYSPVSVIVFLVPMLLFSYVGLFLGVVAKRWGTNGVMLLILLSIVVLGGLVVLINWVDGWPSVGDWIGGQPGLALAAGWTLLPLAVAAAGSYGLTRRAIP